MAEARAAEAARDVPREAQQLLEFYFGDSNLLKDRFLRQKIEESEGGWVPLAVMATFNKLRALTGGELEDIRAGVLLSDELKLGEDRASVARIRALPTLADDDSHLRTLYVEGLPPHVTIEELQELVAPWGATSYVSIPRFKDPAGGAGRSKGFAFIEMSSQQQAASCAADMAARPPTLREAALHVMTKREWQESKQRFRAEQQRRHARASQAEREAASAAREMLAELGSYTKNLVLRFVGEGKTPSHTQVRQARMAHLQALHVPF